ncbi:MAG: LysM peptidoglycan-binding domain-containing protein [Oscillospiraceae bacterium]|jgi:GH25 family lysozyme M1 (1,4-beta-N-acetylmuramidase)|nr:LysM peptidoglycan-binding domain-containing protein [Oscillospiraceae bacterium]
MSIYASTNNFDVSTSQENIKGLDVSAFQGNIDWKQVEKSEFKFAMIRATYGNSGVDTKFHENIKNIQGTNIAPGAYHYCYAINSAEATKEANHFVNIIGSYELRYPLALDIEDRSISMLNDKEKITNIILTFINVLKNANFYPMIYTTENWLTNFIDTNKISDIDIWIGQWGKNLNYKQNVGIWQYSNSGTVAGIGNNVNMDTSYKDYEKLIESLKQNPINTKTNSQPNISASAPKNQIQNQNSFNNSNSFYSPNATTNQNFYSKNISEPISYTVRANDTLWNLAIKFLGDGNKYKEIQQLNQLLDESLHVGQILMIPQNPNSSWTLYTVKRGDTLSNLSNNYLGSSAKYREIMSINSLSNDAIYPGQILKIPVDLS